MGKKSKSYGKAFEYEVRDLLREHTGLESFERVPTSGAWISGANAYKAKTGRADVTEIMAGDIICPQGWRWTVEVKNHESVPVHQLAMGERCPLVDQFLEQTISAANIANKEPLLIMKWRRKAYVLPAKLKASLKASNIKEPVANSTTIGILVGELADNSDDIKERNHIRYTNANGIAIRFFNFMEWLTCIKQRQFVV